MNKNTLNLYLEILDKERQEVLEIAIQKAYTIGRRGEYRDYYDLYFINFNITPVSDNTLLTPEDVNKYFEDLVKSFI